MRWGNGRAVCEEPERAHALLRDEAVPTAEHPPATKGGRSREREARMPRARRRPAERAELTGVYHGRKRGANDER